jgi:preprotein translocase subunit SecY
MRRSAWRFLFISSDIRNRILISIGLLILYRFVAHVPVPGINRLAIEGVMAGSGQGQTLFGLLDLLSGGTVSNFSVLAMGVYPYITAQIILQSPRFSGVWKRTPEKRANGRKSGHTIWRCQWRPCRL